MASGEETSASAENGPATAEVEAERGGCLKFGWGCLPVLVGCAALTPLLALLH